MRLSTLQSLRFVFVMMILMSHFDYQSITAFDAGGDCGVAFFFLLSGFVVAMGYGERIDNGTFDYRRFLRRRFLKLYPLHLACLVFYLVVSRSPIDLRVLLNALLIQCWVPDIDYYFACNSVSWFLSCMLFCYFVFPLLYRYASRKLLTVVMIAYVALCLWVPDSRLTDILYVNPLVRMVDFFLGIMLYRFYRDTRFSPPAWMEVALAFLLVVSLAAYPYMDDKWRNAPVYWIVLIPLIAVYAKGVGPVSKILKTKTMTVLGTLSMPIFLTHQMLIGILIHRLPAWPSAVMLSCCVVAAIAVGWMVERFFLRPLDRFI